MPKYSMEGFATVTIEQEEQNLRQKQHRRIRRLKRLLRPLPRKANVHRYPGLRWFAAFARKRAYLWSFRYKAVAPAVYAGSILTFQPLYGLQIATACLLSVLLRANLPILVGLQLVTNPLTVAPIYFICFQFGHLFLRLFGIVTITLSMPELKLFLDRLWAGDWGDNIQFLLEVFGITSLGGLILGTFTGSVMAVAYKIMAKRAAATYERIRELQLAREREVRRVNVNPQRRLFRKGKKSRRKR